MFSVTHSRYIGPIENLSVMEMLGLEKMEAYNQGDGYQTVESEFIVE